MRQQRDQALACFVMALAISASVFLAVFGAREKRALDDARHSEALHETLLKDAELDLQRNQGALAETKAALQRMSKP